MTPVWSIVEYRGHQGLKQLEADWTRLVTAMPDRAVHHTYETHVAYFNHLSLAQGRFTCLALTHGDRVRAVCPLEARTVQILGRKATVWGLPSDPHMRLRDVICPADDALRELLPRVVRYLGRASERPACLVFDRVLEGSAAWRCLQSLDHLAYCTNVAGASAFFDCERPFSELASRVSRKFRSNLRNAHRKLEALDGVHVENATDAPSLGRELEAFFQVEASGWKGEAGTQTAIRLKHELMAFYRDIAVTLRGIGRCEINGLYAEGRCIASLFCVRTGAEYTALKIGHDDRYARAAPGQLLLEWTLERCCRDPQISRLGMVSNAEWLRVWRPEVVPVHSVYIGLGRWAGPVLVAILRTRFKYGPRIKGWLLRFGLGSPLVRWWPRGASDSSADGAR